MFDYKPKDVLEFKIMSLISSIASLSTQKYLTSKNLLFQVERVLQNYKKASISVQECHEQICELIDKDGKVQKKIEPTTVVKEQVSSNPFGPQMSSSGVTFVSDDQPDPVANIFEIGRASCRERV